MMRNIKLTIEYDGTNYAGWQTQNSHKSIQETIEKALKKILREKVRIIGSGRTDAGVHALAQVANFRTRSRIPLLNLQKALNSNLPKDIAIVRTEEADSDFHSCFDAKSKIYRYCILNRPYPSALLRERVCFYHYLLDISLMRREARYLLGRHDFKSFCASGSDDKDTIRTIKNIKIRKVTPNSQLLIPNCIFIDIEANGFLYNMARNIVGTLVEIGRSKMPAQSMKKILKARDRKAAGPTMPAKGLCLVEVKY